MSDEDIIQLGKWLHDMEEGNLSASDSARLDDLLLRDPEARRMAVERLHLSASLCSLADEAQVVPAVAKPDTAVRRVIWPAMAIAASIAILALAGELFRASQTEKPESRDSGCAVLVETVNAKWAGRGASMQTGRTLPAGHLKLESGVARLEFYSGASMTLQGPCELDLVSESSAKCAVGEMRVHVPRHAHGFTVTAPDCTIVDLGTEFGLRVDKFSHSEMHVFEGSVSLTPPNDPAETLNEGTGWIHGQGRVATASGIRSSFVDIEAMRGLSADADSQRLASWRKGMTQWAADPRCLIAYTFETTQEWDRTLRNSVAKAPPETNGSIVGAHWVKGRWQGKLGLDFRSVGDRVRLSVPGSHSAATLSTWVRVGGLDRRFNSLFLSDGWHPGNLHWHLHQTGIAIMGVKSAGSLEGVRSPIILDPSKLGMWHHFATTIDLRTGEGRHYFNGRMVAETHEKSNLDALALNLGNAQLGNWTPESKGSVEMNVRNFTGVMDEFLLFNQALRPDEIARIYELGRPD